MKVIIAGSRSMTNYEVVKQAVNESGFVISEVVCGMARGVDLLGREWALRNSVLVKEMPADWNRFGKSAGYKRNVQMAEVADALIAIWDGVSRGTKHMIDIAKNKGLLVYIKRVG